MVSERLIAPAKLTLGLRIIGVRGDGYHVIDAEMITLDLADVLEVESRDPPDVGASGGSGAIEVIDGATGRIETIPTGEDNLVARALRCGGRVADVRLTKFIAPGAGLGGGSADAAAILRWAGVTDLDVAAEIGADVPFCLVGGRARVRGIGERVTPLPFVEQTVTLLTPPFGCSTPRVYAVWDDLGGPAADGPNDLEAAALVVEPRLAAYRDRLGDATGATPVLAGSGSTWFVPGAHPGAGRIVARATPARVADLGATRG